MAHLSLLKRLSNQARLDCLHQVLITAGWRLMLFGSVACLPCYRLQAQVVVERPIELTTVEIVELATANSPASRLQDYQSQRPDSILPIHDPRVEEVAVIRRNLLCYFTIRQLQYTAWQAKSLHHRLSAVDELTDVADSTSQLLAHAVEVSDRAEKYGLPIKNPDQLTVNQLDLLDSVRRLESQEIQVRSGLGRLIDATIACSYQPIECDIQCQEFADNCCDQLVTEALQRRNDLRALQYLFGQIDDTKLPLMREWIAPSVAVGSSASLPSLGVPTLSLLSRVQQRWGRSQPHEVNLARSVVRDSIETLREKIVSEVQIAFEKLKEARDRLCIAERKLELQKERILQLQSYGDKIASQAADILIEEQALRSTQRDIIERRLELRLAMEDLILAIGR